MAAVSDVEGSATERAVEAFRAWLQASGGKAARTVSARSSAYRAVLERDPHLPARPAWERIEALPIADFHKKEARPLPGLLALMEDDRDEMQAERSFAFVEVNPGIGSFGFAAEEAGGRPCGAVLVAPKAADHYRVFQGEGSLMDGDEGREEPDVVLATLPFTVFPGNDPAFAQVCSAAFAAAKGVPVMFRTDWTAGQRMEADVESFVSAIRVPAGCEVRHFVLPNLPFVPMRGEELFIGVSRKWTAPFRAAVSDPASVAGGDVVQAEAVGLGELPATTQGIRFPAQPAGRIDADYFHDPRSALVRTRKGLRMLYPQEIARLLGIPSTFPVPRDPDTAYHLLGESVAIPVAARAVRGLLRAVGVA